MPDPNKHSALAAQGFQIARTCSTCVHWAPAEGHWGRCALAVYEHGKHSGEKKAGTPDIGTCDKHGIDLRAVSLAAGEDYAARYAPEDV